MAVPKILVPYNFTSHEWRAFDFIISTFANRTDVKITLFHAYVPLPEIDFASNPEMKKMVSGWALLSEELRQKELGLKSVKDYFLENTFLQDQIDHVLKRKEKDIAVEILEAIDSGHYTMLVLTPTPGKVSRLFGRSIHEKVLRNVKDITVCIAT